MRPHGALFRQEQLKVAHLRGKVPEMLDQDFELIEITEDRRTKKRQRDKHDRAIRKEIMRERPAYVRRAAQKADAKRVVPARRQLAAIRQKYDPNRHLAADITCYVDRSGGEIRGSSLLEIYTEFAREFLQETSRNAIEQVGSAVQFAMGKAWLEAKEAEGCTFSIPGLSSAA